MYSTLFLLILLLLCATPWKGWSQPFASGARTHAPASGQGVDARLLLEDGEGGVWVSGPNGTFRYDGVRYLPASVFGLPMTPATQFEQTADGTLWVLLGERLWWRDGARFYALPESERFEALAAGGDLLYVLQPPGLLTVLTRTKGGARPNQLPGDSRRVLEQAGESWWLTRSTLTVRQRQIQGRPDGKVWFGTFKSFTWAQWSGTGWTSGTVELSPPTDPLWQVVPVGEQDFLSTDGHSVVHYRREKTSFVRRSLVASESRLAREHIFTSAYGTWVLIQGTCVRLLPDGQSIEYFRYGGPQALHGLYAGKRVLWASAGQAGLLSFARDRTIEWIDAYDSSVAPARFAVHQGDRLLFGRADLTYEVAPALRTWDAGLGEPLKVQGTRWFGLPAAAAPYVDSAVAPDGSLWQLLTKAGAAHLTAEGQFLFTAAGHTAGRRLAQMRRMTVSADGRVWVASTENLWEVTPGTESPQPVYRPGGPWQGQRYVADFVQDRANALYAVTDGGPLRYASGQWSEEKWPGCLLEKAVATMAIEGANSWWIAYRNRPAFTHASRFGNGGWNCRHFDAEHDFPGRAVFLRFDRRGWLWRGDAQGVWVATGPEKSCPRDWVRLGPAEGLLDAEMTPVFLEEPDGQVLVGVGHMLQRIPPGLVKPSPTEPPAFSVLEQGGEVRALEASVRVKQGEAASLLVGLPAGDLPGALPSLEYRYGAEAWKPLEGYALPLADAEPGAVAAQVRFAGSNLTRALEVQVLPVWWRGWPARMAFAGLAGAGVWMLIPLFQRAVYRFGKWRYQRRNSPAFTANLPLAPLPEWPAGTLLQKRYRVDGILARGGFSDIFAATDEETGQAVVIKRLRPLPFTAERSLAWLKKRFLREVGVASLLRHPGILPVLDAWFDDDGIPHIALPRVHGVNLREYLTERAPLPRTQALHFLRSIAETVQAAHERGVIHCDLKPENIMIPAASGESPVRPIVVDFGTSALHLQSTVLSEQTVTGGTLRYMAPEQLLGRYSTATDVYAFAITALELLIEVRYDSLDLPIDRDWEANLTDYLRSRDLPEETSALLVAALRWDPTQRPAELLQWATALLRSLA